MKEYNEVEYSSDEEDIKKKKKPKIPRAPRKITPLPNPDKKLHEKSHNPMRLPNPKKLPRQI